MLVVVALVMVLVVLLLLLPLVMVLLPVAVAGTGGILWVRRQRRLLLLLLLVTVVGVAVCVRWRGVLTASDASPAAVAEFCQDRSQDVEVNGPDCGKSGERAGGGETLTETEMRISQLNRDLGFTRPRWQGRAFPVRCAGCGWPESRQGKKQQRERECATTA